MEAGSASDRTGGAFEVVTVPTGDEAIEKRLRIFGAGPDVRKTPSDRSP